MNSWSFSPVGGTGFTVAVALGLVLVMLVGPATDRISRKKRLSLFVLRCATAILLLLIMCRPTLVATVTERIPGSLVLLLDNSRSMQIADSLNNASRWNALKAVLADSQEQLSELSDTWDLKIYQFDESTKPVQLTD